MTENSQITELSPLAREVYFESKLQHSKSGKLIIHFNDQSQNACPVSVSDAGLRYALLSLVNNATRASDETGDIFIELKTQGWKCVLDVVDYGRSISPDLLRKISANSSIDSEDHDLCNVSRLVRNAHGAFTVESMRGQGTRVRIELPLVSKN